MAEFTGEQLSGSEESPVLDAVLWIQTAVDHPAVGGLGSLLAWAGHHFAPEQIAEMARLSRALNADSNADIDGYSELATKLVSAGVEQEVLRLVDGLVANPGVAVIAKTLGPLVPTATQQALTELCQHLFGGAEIGLTGENYLGWARLAAGQGTVDDARYIVHELHELLALKADGYAPQPRGHEFDGQAWDKLYEIHHAAANKAECAFLATRLAAFTGREVSLSAEEVAAADPIRAEGRETYFGGAANVQHQKAAVIPVQLSEPVRKKLGLATATPTRAQVVAAFKALPANALTS